MTDIKEIRKNLKAKLGYNARKVSVSQKGSTIKFTIRNEEVDYTKLKEFTQSCESISYDEATQCILRGGNTFTRIDFTEEVRESMTAKYLEAVEAAISKLSDDTCLEDIEGTTYMIGKSLNGFSLWIKEDRFGRHLTECCSAKDVAFTIAIR
jgi:hypothetical protein